MNDNSSASDESTSSKWSHADRDSLQDSVVGCLLDLAASFREPFKMEISSFPLEMRQTFQSAVSEFAARVTRNKSNALKISGHHGSSSNLSISMSTFAVMDWEVRGGVLSGC